MQEAKNFNHSLAQRIFERWNYSQHRFPCPLEMPNDTESQLDGLLYVKLWKTGSSTLAGINLRIANNSPKYMGMRDTDVCRHQNHHLWETKLDKCMRDKSRSFLWSFVRHPTKRAISSFFFFQVSRRNCEPTDENFLRYLSRDPTSNIDYIKYLSCGIVRVNETNRTKAKNHDIQRLLDEYNFIGITERMDESLVLLQIILGLHTRDILYLSAKTNGRYDDGRFGNCTLIKPSFVSPKMERYFASSRWKNKIHNNLALYEAVNRSLDLTIDSIGKTKFDGVLHDYLTAKKLATNACHSSAKFPCSEDGKKRKYEETNCYLNDFGCGYECLNDFFHAPKGFKLDGSYDIYNQ